VDLLPEEFRDQVTVTAIPGRAAALEDVAQRVNVIGEEGIALRAKAVLAQAASEEVGLHLQRTSPTIAGVFVRGLTVLNPPTLSSPHGSVGHPPRPRPRHGLRDRGQAPWKSQGSALSPECCAQGLLRLPRGAARIPSPR
jgi:hypothetical protein